MAMILVHGGAGTLFKGKVSETREVAARQGLTAALAAGTEALSQDLSAMDAAIVAVRELEDCEIFNAGRGSVYTHEGGQEMDAAVMDGTRRQAGAIAGVRGIRNPIDLAHAVWAHSPHVLLSGPGAEAFAERQGIARAPAEYFASEYRWAQLQQLQERERQAASKPPDSFGTVGAVVLDAYGHLAVATSTGGMTNKRYGRIGDSPLLGQGTYADDRACAVSATGHGEFIMRANLAYDVAARMRYLGVSLAEAAQGAMREFEALGGQGGLIALDAEGNWVMPFNTSRMYRGSQKLGEAPQVWVY